MVKEWFFVILLSNGMEAYPMGENVPSQRCEMLVHAFNNGDYALLPNRIRDIHEKKFYMSHALCVDTTTIKHIIDSRFGHSNMAVVDMHKPLEREALREVEPESDADTITLYRKKF